MARVPKVGPKGTIRQLDLALRAKHRVFPAKHPVVTGPKTDYSRTTLIKLPALHFSTTGIHPPQQKVLPREQRRRIATSQTLAEPPVPLRELPQ